jgi:hypothetical protein
MLISVEGRGKIQPEPGQDSVRGRQLFSNFQILEQARLVCWSILKEKPTVVLHFRDFSF